MFVLDTQQRRRMHSDDKLGTVGEIDGCPAHLGDGHGLAGDAARRCDAARDDGRRFDQVALVFEQMLQRSIS